MWLPLELLLLPTLSEWGGAEVLETQGVQVELLDERGRNDRLDVNYVGQEFLVGLELPLSPTERHHHRTEGGGMGEG